MSALALKDFPHCLHGYCLSSECTISCLLRYDTSEKYLSHVMHPKGFFPVWLLSWYLRLGSLANVLPHCSQWKGFSPVWTLWCKERSKSFLKHFPQWAQANGFSLEWVLSCSLRLLAFANNLLQTLHGNHIVPVLVWHFENPTLSCFLKVPFLYTSFFLHTNCVFPTLFRERLIILNFLIQTFTFYRLYLFKKLWWW